MGEPIKLDHRSVIEVSGPDAHDFLQGILTNDIDGVEDDKAIYAGLLTPQGKLLFDFIVVQKEGSYFFDVDAILVGDLVKRLMFYKLRADVEIAVLGMAVLCADIEGRGKAGEDRISYPDPRFEKMGSRLMIFEPANASCAPDPEKWLAHRISYALPEAGQDFTHGNCFPHDIAMDQLNGIGFSKGCYVGQEVVSRMQHRGTARKRPMIVKGNENLPAEASNITADGGVIGSLGSVLGKNGIAQIRLDRALKALENGKPIDIDGIKVELFRPQWASYGEEFNTVAE